jgi:nitrite reductase/ring-hydroxylating ferredoxin subunit
VTSGDDSGCILVGTRADFPQPGARLIVSVGGTDVAVFRIGEDLVAFQNSCPHQGGPIGWGLVAPRVEAIVGDDGSVTERFSSSEQRLVCPWHAWEFDPGTGRCSADPRYGLVPREVVVRGDEIYLRV